MGHLYITAPSPENNFSFVIKFTISLAEYLPELRGGGASGSDLMVTPLPTLFTAPLFMVLMFLCARGELGV